MDVQTMMGRLEAVLDNSKVAVLTTVDDGGCPHVRWMTPGLVKGRPECLYALTSPKFRKLLQVAACPKVEWMMQTRSLDEVIVVRGTMEVIDNPGLKSEVTEAIGRNLEVFWRINPDAAELVVLETTIETIERFLPLSGRKETARFSTT